MGGFWRSVMGGAACVCAVAVWSGLALGQAKVPAAPRSANVIALQLQDLDGELEAANAKGALVKQEGRAEAGAAIVPLLKKQNQLIEELGRADAKAGAGQQYKVLKNMAMMSTLGDEETEKRLEGLSKNAAGGAAQAFYAKVALTMRDWWVAGADASAQGKVVEQIRAVAKQAPKDELVTSAVLEMMWVGAATKELATQVQDIVYKELKSEGAERYKAVPRVGRPLVITGVVLVPGVIQPLAFTSEKWKGKVIVVHVWSTGNAESRKQLEVMKKLETEMGESGLELLGVANASEGSLKDLQAYVAERGVKWPQLVDPKNPGWQGVMGTWHVPHMGTVYVIDRLGVVRAVNPEVAKAGELLKELLEEKVVATTQGKK